MLLQLAFATVNEERMGHVTNDERGARLGNLHPELKDENSALVLAEFGEDIHVSDPLMALVALFL